MLSQGSLPPLAKGSGLKDHGAASANTWVSSASRALFGTGKCHLPACRAWVRVPREPASVKPSGIWDSSSSLLMPHVAGADRGHQCSVQPQPQHPLATYNSLLAARGVGWGPGEQLQPDSQGWFGHGFACQGSPRASPRPQHRARPAQLCSALLQTSPAVPEDSPAPALSPNTILAACFLPHASCSK